VPKQQTTQAGVLIDLAVLYNGAASSGPQWSYESADLDLTLLSWRSQQQVVTHVNNEVDVLLIVVVGAGEVMVNNEVYQLAAGQAC